MLIEAESGANQNIFQGVTLEFFAREIVAWEKSPERLEQMAGERYYSGEHDILKRKREAESGANQNIFQGVTHSIHKVVEIVNGDVQPFSGLWAGRQGHENHLGF